MNYSRIDCKNEMSCSDVIVAPSIEAKYSKCLVDSCILFWQGGKMCPLLFLAQEPQPPTR